MFSFSQTFVTYSTRIVSCHSKQIKACSVIENVFSDYKIREDIRRCLLFMQICPLSFVVSSAFRFGFNRILGGNNNLPLIAGEDTIHRILVRCF